MRERHAALVVEDCRAVGAILVTYHFEHNLMHDTHRKIWEDSIRRIQTARLAALQAMAGQRALRHLASMRAAQAWASFTYVGRYQ